MSRCSHSSLNVCPFSLRNSSSNFLRLGSARALKTASIALNMQPYGCMSTKTRRHQSVTIKFFAAPSKKACWSRAYAYFRTPSVHRCFSLFDSRAGPGLRVRVRQWVPRYRKRGRDGDLHEYAQTVDCSGVVWLVEPHWCVDVIRPGGVRQRRAAAGRTGDQRWLRSWLCNGVRAFARCHDLEPRYVVSGVTSIKLPFVDWLNHGRWVGQCSAVSGASFWRGRQLGES